MPFAGDEYAARAAIDALLALDLRVGDELILADNSGLAVARGGVAVIRAAGERSPAHARNVGAASAHGEWILFLDADCRAPRWLLDAYFAVPVADDVGALAGEVVPLLEGDTLAARYGSARSFLSQEAHLKHPYRPRAVAANLLVRREAFEQVGGFYEGVRAAEDTDFSWRLQRAGWKLELRRGAQVEHRYRATLGELRKQWRGYAAGRAWLSRRYDGFEPEPAGSAGGRARAPADAAFGRRRGGGCWWPSPGSAGGERRTPRARPLPGHRCAAVGRRARRARALEPARAAGFENGRRSCVRRRSLPRPRRPAGRIRACARRRAGRGGRPAGVPESRDRGHPPDRLPRGRRDRRASGGARRAGRTSPAACGRRRARPPGRGAAVVGAGAGGAPAGTGRARARPRARGERHPGDRPPDRAAGRPAARRGPRGR